jgi:putative transposase
VNAAPDKIGRHKVAILSSANGDWLQQHMRSDFTLRGPVAELAGRGVKIDYRVEFLPNKIVGSGTFMM